MAKDEGYSGGSKISNCGFCKYWKLGRIRDNLGILCDGCTKTGEIKWHMDVACREFVTGSPPLTDSSKLVKIIKIIKDREPPIGLSQYYQIFLDCGHYYNMTGDIPKIGDEIRCYFSEHRKALPQPEREGSPNKGGHNGS